MDDRAKKYEELRQRQQAIADEMLTLYGPPGPYGEEERLLVTAASKAQEVAFFLRDAAKAANGEQVGMPEGWRPPPGVSCRKA
jgi:hypothetical protein